MSYVQFINKVKEVFIAEYESIVKGQNQLDKFVTLTPINRPESYFTKNILAYGEISKELIGEVEEDSIGMEWWIQEIAGALRRELIINNSLKNEKSLFFEELIKNLDKKEFSNVKELKYSIMSLQNQKILISDETFIKLLKEEEFNEMQDNVLRLAGIEIIKEFDEKLNNILIPIRQDSVALEYLKGERVSLNQPPPFPERFNDYFHFKFKDLGDRIGVQVYTLTKVRILTSANYSPEVFIVFEHNV